MFASMVGIAVSARGVVAPASVITAGGAVSARSVVAAASVITGGNAVSAKNVVAAASVSTTERQRSLCKECGGGSICEHERQRSLCKECGGSSICRHERQRSQCKVCTVRVGCLTDHDQQVFGSCYQCYAPASTPKLPKKYHHVEVIECNSPEDIASRCAVAADAGNWSYIGLATATHYLFATLLRGGRERLKV
jgi:hypothetical protein